MGKLLITAMVCIFLFACKPPEEDRPRLVFDKAAFERERAAWEAQGITSYTFEIREFFSAGPGPHIQITVTDGKITDIENLIDDEWSDLERYDPSRLVNGWGTISSVYDRIAERYANALAYIDNYKEDEYRYIHIKYNPRYHYPEEVSEGRNSYTQPMIGGYGHYFIYDFQPAP